MRCNWTYKFCGNIIELVMKRYTNIQNIWYKRTCELIPLYLELLLYTEHYRTLWLTARISSLIWYEIQTKEVWIKWLSQLAKSKMAQLVQSMDKKYTNIFSFLHMFRFLLRWYSGIMFLEGRCKLKFIHFLFLDMRDMILGLRDLYNRNRYHAKQKLGNENPLFYMCLI